MNSYRSINSSIVKLLNWFNKSTHSGSIFIYSGNWWIILRNTSLFDNYKILGPFDPKVTFAEKKCPKCVDKNIHLTRIMLTGYTPIFKCKYCEYVETTISISFI